MGPVAAPSVAQLSLADSRRTPLPGGLMAVAAGLAASLAVVTLVRHWFYLSHTFDLGFYTQDVWAIAHGTWRNTVSGFHVFADHFSPVLILLAPAAFISPPEVLLLIQAVVVAAGIFPAYRLGLRHGDAKRARLASAWYALSAGIWHAVTFDFHPLTLGVPLLMWVIAEVDANNRSLRPLLIALGLALVREDLAILAGVVLIQGAYIHRSRRMALSSIVPAAIGIGYTVWISLYSGEMSGYHLWTRFASGTSATSVQGALSSIASDLVRPDALVGYGALLLPVLVISVFVGWRRSWPGLVILIFNGVASYSAQATLYYQYLAPAVPFLIWGAVHVWSRRKSTSDGPAYLATVAVFLVLGPLIYIGYGLPDRYATHIASSGDRRVLNEVISAIDPAVAVSATDFLLPHLATRSEVYLFPGPMVCSSSLIFHVPRTSFPPVIAIEFGDAVEGADWSKVLRQWGYAKTYSNDIAAVWELERDPPPSKACASMDEVRRGLAEQARIGDGE